MSIRALKQTDYFPDRNARVLVHREIHQLPIPQHRHEFFEIAIVLSGSGIHVTGQFRHELQAGDVLVINNRRAHGFERTQGLNLINLLIRDDVMARVERELRALPGYHALFSAKTGGENKDSYPNHLQLTATELAQVEDWANRLETETHEGFQGGYFLAEAYLVLIVGALSRRYGKNAPLRNRPPGSLKRVLSWMEKNLHQPLRIADLARQAGMSERSFYRAFGAAMGMSPGDYVIKIRVRRAAEKLRNADSSLRIGEIAQSCGFEDVNYFSRTFRRVMGKGPREFRKT